jgi:hypothetical protein
LVGAILEKYREKLYFLKSRGGSGERFEEFAEFTKIGVRPWKLFFGRNFRRRRFEELKLVVTINRPGFDAPSPKITSEFASATVKGIDKGRGDFFD